MMPFGFLQWVCWNVFLAAIPVGAAYAFASLESRPSKNFLLKLSCVFWGTVWFVFLPNSCYLLTEWRHFFDQILGSDLYRHAWSHPGRFLEFAALVAFYALFSGIGVLCFGLSIRKVAPIIFHRLSSPGIALFFFLMALGVYLGLVLRFNSWDVVTRPHLVVDALAKVAGRPLLLGLIVGFAAFLWVLYAAVDIFLDGLQQRYEKFLSRNHTTATQSLT